MTYEELRQEFTNPVFRNNMVYSLGTKCVNCGNKEHIEYHHIVPLKNGGTNNLGNIVPLCQKCHKLAHNKIHRNTYNSGRPKAIEFKDAEPILHRYYNMEIGTKETKELLGLSLKNKSTFPKLKKEYEQKYNITNFYNNIDLKNSQTKRMESLTNNKNNKSKIQ